MIKHTSAKQAQQNEELVQVFYHNTTYGNIEPLPTSPRTTARPGQGQAQSLQYPIYRIALLGSCIVGLAPPYLPEDDRKGTSLLYTIPCTGLPVPCIVGTGLAPVLRVGRGGPGDGWLRRGMVAPGTGVAARRGGPGDRWLRPGMVVPGADGCGAPQPPTSSQSFSLFQLLQFQLYWIISNILPCLLKLLSITYPTIMKPHLPDNALTFQSISLDMFQPRHRSQ